MERNPYKKGGLFEGALPTVFRNAKHLRNNVTAETVLWLHLRGGLSGWKFRRQHPIGMYIAAFYCFKAALIIEGDGSIHNTEDVKKNDEKKETFYANKGFGLLRFCNDEVRNKIEVVLAKITTVININIRKHFPPVAEAKSPAGAGLGVLCNEELFYETPALPVREF